jgi:hypothetical protein
VASEGDLTLQEENSMVLVHVHPMVLIAKSCGFQLEAIQGLVDKKLQSPHEL